MILLVPAMVLRRTPSREELILRATVLLRLPQLTGVSAAAIFQRFYYRRSLLEFDVRVMAPAALLLACKLEETHRGLRDIVVVFYRLRMRALRSESAAAVGTDKSLYAGIPTSGPSAEDIAELKQAVMVGERHILRELGFVAATLLEHPHKYVLQFVKSLKKTSDWVLCELAQTAWNFLNDATRAPLCCEFQPHEIACADWPAAALAAPLVCRLRHGPRGAPPRCRGHRRAARGGGAARRRRGAALGLGRPRGRFCRALSEEHRQHVAHSDDAASGDTIPVDAIPGDPYADAFAAIRRGGHWWPQWWQQ
mmetsp:Transcript_20211/g.65302  ORF Transcript_20211/g.65302 Transcript_20211/m.65302 type:complete len:309 (-) Transcript_20211:193-1119(-)